MGGFAAIFNRDGAPVASEALDRMLSRIAYRGRDGLGRSIEGPVALGYAAFHTTPESIHENQPHRDETGSIVVTFDGRVDNREELTAALTAAGAVLRDDTDVEIVLRAYLEWGEEAPLKIIGDFAMVVWDGRNRRLFCARDAFGMRPFIYHLGARGFYAGSDLRQVLEASGIVRKPNEGIVAEYLVADVVSTTETLFEGIMRLAPGHIMVVGPDEFRIRRYYDIDITKRIRYRTDEQYAEHLLGLMKESVRVRMRAIGGVASHLSGGVDSSSIVAIAAGLIRDGAAPRLPFETLTVDFTEPESDERHHVDAVVAKLGIKANRQPPILVDREEYEEQARRYLDTPDSPLVLMSGPLMRDIAERGFRVLFGGEGGDEWLDGNLLYLADLLKSLRLIMLIRCLRNSAAHARADGVRFSYIRRAFAFAFLPLLPSHVAFKIRKLLQREISPATALRPEFSERVGLSQRLIAYGSQPLAGATLSQNDARNWIMHGWVPLSFDLVNRNFADMGIEYRSPLYDRRIVEFALTIPEEQRRGPNPTKFAMRNAMRGLIPETVRNRPDKADFSHIYMKTLRKFGGTEFFDTLSIAKTGWIDQATVSRMYRDAEASFQSGGRSFRGEVWRLFGLVEIDMWFRAAFGG